MSCSLVGCSFGSKKLKSRSIKKLPKPKNIKRSKSKRSASKKFKRSASKKFKRSASKRSVSKKFKRNNFGEELNIPSISNIYDNKIPGCGDCNNSSSIYAFNPITYGQCRDCRTKQLADESAQKLIMESNNLVLAKTESDAEQNKNLIAATINPHKPGSQSSQSFGYLSKPEYEVARDTYYAVSNPEHQLDGEFKTTSSPLQ